MDFGDLRVSAPPREFFGDQTMFDFFRRNTAPPERKSATPLIALSLTARPSWGARDYAGLAREGVMKNAVVYRCIRMIAEAAASVPFLLYDGAQELDTHPLLTLLANPNSQEDGAAFFARWYAFLQCAGNAYMEAATA